jgi:excisionase family DNA binding protein
MEQKLLVQMTSEELETLIINSVSNALNQRKQTKEVEEKLLKRKDVAKYFSISLVTVNEWMKAGKLPFHKINSRVFFKKSEVETAMQTPVKTKRKR